MDEIVSVSSNLDSIEPSKTVKAIDIVLREVYIELKDDAGLYFISELKEYIGEKYVLAFENLGVDLDAIQSEQHQLYSLQYREKSVPTIETETEQKAERIDDANLLNYT